MEKNDSVSGPTIEGPERNTIRPNEVDSHPNLTSPINNINNPTPKTNQRKLLLLCLVLILIISVISFLFWHKKNKVVQSLPLTKITVQLEWINNPEFAGMYAAQDLGYYKDTGLNVSLKEFQETSDVNKEVANGTVDYGVSSPLEVVMARGNGEKNKAIAAIYQVSAFSIVSPKAENITSPSNFKGKILGDSGNNNEAKVTYEVLMASAGIKSSDVTVKPVDFDIIKAFSQAQTADVFRTDQIFELNQAGIAFNQIFPEQYGFAIYGDVLISSDKMIVQKPLQTQAFVKATMKGWQYVIDHPAAALTMLAKHDNVLYKDPNYAKFDLTNTLPLIKATGSQAIGSMQFVPWNRAYQGVAHSGLLKNNYNVTDLYTSEFVK